MAFVWISQYLIDYSYAGESHGAGERAQDAREVWRFERSSVSINDVTAAQVEQCYKSFVTVIEKKSREALSS